MDLIARHLIHQPLWQALLFLLITTLIIPFLRSKGANATWNAAGVSYVGFIVVNAICLWFAINHWTYLLISLGISVLYLLVVAIQVPLLIRTFKIKGSGESAMIFLFIIYHPAILLGVILLKWVVNFF